MATFSEIKNGINNIARDIERERNNRDTGREQIESANAKIGAMQAKYTGLAADINALAAAEPNNPAALTAKAEKDKLVTEFLALKNEVQAQVDALEALDAPA